MNRKARDAGFTLLEVLVVLAVIVVLVGMIVPARRGGKPNLDRLVCVNNLKRLGLAFRVYAQDNNHQFPTALLASNTTDLSTISIVDLFRSISNNLGDPKIIYCPADKKREAAENFANLSAKNVSYFVSFSGREEVPGSMLAGDRNMVIDGVPAAGFLTLGTNQVLSWSKEMHIEQGDILRGDGSVQQMSSSRLRNSLQSGYFGITNQIVFP